MTDAAPKESPLKVAYIMSRFPKITETFVLYEIIAVEQAGVQVEIYPLMREHTTVMHPEAVPLVKRAKFQGFISAGIIGSNLYYLATQPLTYFRTLFTSLKATWGSSRYFGGIIVFFPKAVRMAHLMKQDDIRHIHAHFASHPAAVAYIIHELTGIPYSFTAHGSDLHRDKKMLREKLASSRFAVAISQNNRNVMIEASGQDMADRIMILHCGVDTTAFLPRTEQANGSAPKILCIGTLHEVKGQRYLLEACRILKERGIAFQCELIGDGEDRAMLEELTAQANLKDHVCFHGQIPRNEVIRILQGADILATPSVPTQDGRREGIPVATMEGMACAIPVVASRLSGIPELVEDGETGMLVEPRDVEGIANALQTLLETPSLRQKMGMAGREKIQREFSLSENAATLARLFAGDAL